MTTLIMPAPTSPVLLPDRTMHPAWRDFFAVLVTRTGGYAGELITAGNGIAVTDGPTVSIDGADAVEWTAKQTFDRACFQPSASVTPAANGDLEIQMTSNTSLTFKYKGSDGVVRSGSVTLS